MSLSDYKGLNSKNLTHLALTLCHAKVVKSQDTKKEHPLFISFNLNIKLVYILSRFDKKCLDIVGQ